MDAKPLSLRACGREFSRIELRPPVDRFSEMTVEVCDPSFGSFKLTPAMKVEVKDQGRWKEIPLHILVSQLLLARMC